MKEKLKNMGNFFKQYPFTFLAVCLSWIISIFMFLYCIIAIFVTNYMPTLGNIWQHVRSGIFLLIPAVIFSAIIFFWYKFLKDKNHIAQKILQGIILLVMNCVILCAQSILGVIGMVNLAEYDEVAPCHNPKQYKYVVQEHSQNKDFVKIFPKAIPSDAKDVKTWGYITPLMYVYSEKDFVLCFTATPEYIDKEIKRLEPITLRKTPESIKDCKAHNMLFPSDVMHKHIPKIANGGTFRHYPVLFKFEHTDEHHSNHFTGGCFIDKSANKIIYYYAELYGYYCP